MGLETVVGLIRNLMQLSTSVADVGDEGAVPSLWSQLPKIVVVGGQVSPQTTTIVTKPLLGPSEVIEFVLWHSMALIASNFLLTLFYQKGTSTF